MDATVEFMQQISDHLDELMEAANGEKKTLDVLEIQEQKQRQRLFFVQQMAKQREQAPLTPAEEKKLLAKGNRLFQKEKQLERLGQMARDNLLGNKEAKQIIVQAEQAAFERALQAQDIIRPWGDDPSREVPMEQNRELVERVRKNTVLLEIARYLGRMKEMIRQKRMNGFSYGRGEKYGLELGNDFGRLISPEFSLLATPQALPLFIRKYQQKKLKQYAHREKISKGRGPKIVCLDQSGSPPEGKTPPRERLWLMRSCW